MNQETIGQRAALASLRLNMTQAQSVAILTLLSSRTSPERLEKALSSLLEVARAARVTFKARGDDALQAEAMALQVEAGIALGLLRQLHQRHNGEASPLMRAFDGDA